MEFQLLCPECRSKLQSPFAEPICDNCDTVIETRAGALNLLTTQETVELQDLIQRNIDDMVDNEASSTTRQHDVHIYVDSGYCKKLEQELDVPHNATIEHIIPTTQKKH